MAVTKQDLEQVMTLIKSTRVLISTPGSVRNTSIIDHFLDIWFTYYKFSERIHEVRYKVFSHENGMEERTFHMATSDPLESIRTHIVLALVEDIRHYAPPDTQVRIIDF